MDELVIINPAYSGSAVWRCGGVAGPIKAGRRADVTICEPAERSNMETVCV